jgi:alpha-tubulin suppressor-like RCC1 family protein
MYIDYNHNVFGFGSNLKDRMGIEGESDQDIPFPTQIKSLLKMKIIKISCGLWHTVVIDEFG